MARSRDAADRERLLSRLAGMLDVACGPAGGRVAVDGPDAAGKTTLADELVTPLEQRGRLVLRSSIDGFHRCRVERYRRGPESPEGCYRDSFDYEGLRANLLHPLAPGGTRRIRRAMSDVHADAPRPASEETVPHGALLLFDGVFLQRSELQDCWDYVIYVDASSETVLNRAKVRDRDLLGSEEVERRYLARYLPAQQLYRAEESPLERADAVVVNDVPVRARLSVHGAAGARRNVG